MSDVFVSAGLSCNAEAIASRLCWTPYTKSWSRGTSELAWGMTRVDDPGLWSPAYDSQSGVRALIGGRIAPEEAEWAAAEKLPYDGGLACRLIIDLWLKGGAKAVESLNGGAQIFVIDEPRRDLYVWTDRMGFYPAFCLTESGFLLCSHPDVAAAVLEDVGHRCEFDPVTMAEFLQTGTATQPHSYWRNIRQMNAGTRYHFVLGENARLVESKVYWQPAYLERKPYLTDRHEIVDRLATALKSAVQRRTLPRLGKVGVLLSAGADSRVALFGAHDPSAVTCYTLYDEPNAELRGARKLAEIARAKHSALQRSKEYYIENANEAVRVSGGMWTIESAHHTGIVPSLMDDGIGALLTGCYADYMLKGITFDSRSRVFLGRNLPLKKFKSSDFQWHHYHYKLAPEWDREVERRLRDRFGDLAISTEEERSQLEYLRLDQIVREPDASGRLFLRRTLPVDFFMSDNVVVDLFGSICPSEKLNSIAFGMAVARLTGRDAERVLNNNFSARVGASEWERVTTFILASLKRKFKLRSGRQPFDRASNSVATVGSWPNFSRVIERSQELRAWRASLPRDQEVFFFNMLGEERRKWSIDEWAAREPTLFLRFYTASLWLLQNSRAIT